MPDSSVATAPTSAVNSTDGARRPRRPRTQDGTRSQDQGTGAPGRSGPEVSGRAEGAGRPRRPRAPKSQEGRAGEQSFPNPGASTSGPSGGRQGERNGNRRRPVADDPSGAGSGQRPRRPRKPRAPQDGPPSSEVSTSAHTNAGPGFSTAADGTATPKRANRNRGRKFVSELTGGEGAVETAQDVSSADKYKNAGLKADDLTSRLIAELSTPPYPDCLICFAPITPMQPTWSCSPSNPTIAATDDEGGAPAQRADTNAQCCWMTFHLKCIRSWATKSVKDVEEAWRMRGEPRQGDWRCPGCQSKRTAIPASYW